jgi:hypothetical protein
MKFKNGDKVKVTEGADIEFLCDMVMDEFTFNRCAGMILDSVGVITKLNIEEDDDPSYLVTFNLSVEVVVAGLLYEDELELINE